MKFSKKQISSADQKDYELWISEELKLPTSYENLTIFEKLDQILQTTYAAVAYGSLPSKGISKNKYFLASVKKLNFMVCILAKEHGISQISDSTIIKTKE